MKRVLTILVVIWNAQALQAQIFQSPAKPENLAFFKADTAKHTRTFIPANFATCNYGFFCKQELKLEKQTRVPVKFRLGNMEHNNWLEGKRRYKPE